MLFATQRCFVARDEWPLLALSSRSAVCPPLVARHVIARLRFVLFHRRVKGGAACLPGRTANAFVLAKARRPSAHSYFAFLPDCLASTVITKDRNVVIHLWATGSRKNCVRLCRIRDMPGFCVRIVSGPGSKKRQFNHGLRMNTDGKAAQI